jgi:hypothetical protein
LSLHIRRRSFLETPLILKSGDLMEARQTLWDTFISKEQTPARLRIVYVKLGEIAENIIQGAFESGGYGTWDKNSDRTIKEKGSSRPLIDSGQLRDSITSDVVTR